MRQGVFFSRAPKKDVPRFGCLPGFRRSLPATVWPICSLFGRPAPYGIVFGTLYMSTARGSAVGGPEAPKHPDWGASLLETREKEGESHYSPEQL
jgi:hypothetical protein